ncbi:hypothetical protein, partial [Actinomadura livida]|uniref:hypothetical protein n=1 Tax=Actinomadura livida TaxID=79909 RepID=UPI0031D41919
APPASAPPAPPPSPRTRQQPPPPEPAPEPEPTGARSVVRTAKEPPERRNPLGTTLVLVVVAVVISAGTAIAFAR